MTDAGFQPAVVIETSPGNFQVWLNHGQIISDRTFSTQAAKELARRFGGDPSSADWRHFGRLAGFTNQKPKRRLRSGLPPFVRLHECEGRTYSAAREFLEEVKSLAEKASAERTAWTTARVDHRPKIRYDPSLSFTGILGTAAICIALTWRGLYTQRAEAFRNNKSETKYCMLAISQKKADPSGSSITRDEPRSRRSARSSRSAERAAPLWTARRKQIAARHRSACRSRFAALDVVRRRFTASARRRSQWWRSLR